MAKTPPTQKLTLRLTRRLGPYRWVGTWPGFPLPIAADDFPPLRTGGRQKLWSLEAGAGGSLECRLFLRDVAPELAPWVECLYAKVLASVLPEQAQATPDLTDAHYLAAIFGYAFAAFHQEQQQWQSAALRCLTAAEQDQALVQAELAPHFDAPLAAIRKHLAAAVASLPPLECANYLEGFAYGVRCQGRDPSPGNFQTLQCAKAMLRHQKQVAQMIQSGSTSPISSFPKRG